MEVLTLNLRSNLLSSVAHFTNLPKALSICITCLSGKLLAYVWYELENTTLTFGRWLQEPKQGSSCQDIGFQLVKGPCLYNK